MRLKLENNSGVAQHGDGRWGDWRFVAKVWLLSRLFFAVFAYAGHFAHPFQEVIEGGFAGVSSRWLNVWTTYDSQYFLEIARAGYTAKSSAFFPLYPLLLRPFGPDENAMALAGVVISNAAFGGALFLMLRLCQLQLGQNLARTSVWILAFFPSAVYSMAVYTESVFLLFLLGAFLAARRNTWWLAGVLAFLAALTRNAGPVLFLALLVEWFWQRREASGHIVNAAANSNAKSQGQLAPSLWSVLWAFLPLLAFVGMQLYFRERFGGASLLAAQAEFGRAFSWPWLPIWRDLVDAATRNANLVTLLNVLASIGVFVFAWKFRRQLRPSETVFMVGVMLMQLTFSRISPPFTISSLRYVFGTPAFSQALALEFQARSGPKIQNLVRLLALLISAAVAFAFGYKSFAS